MMRPLLKTCVLMGLFLPCLCQQAVADGGYDDSDNFPIDVRTQTTSHYANSDLFSLDSNPRPSGKYSDSVSMPIDSFRVNKAWADSESFQLRTTDVHIELVDIKQEIDGFGGSFAMWGYNPDSNALGKVISDLGVSIVRTQGDPWKYWDEKTQQWIDNDSEWSNKCRYVLKEAANRGVRKFLLSFWYPPDEYLLSNRHWNPVFDLIWAQAIAERIWQFGDFIWADFPDVEIYVSPQNESNLENLWCYWEPHQLEAFIPKLVNKIREVLPDEYENKVKIIAPETSQAEITDIPNWNIIAFASFADGVSQYVYGYNYHIYDNQIGYDILSQRLENFYNVLPNNQYGYKFKNWQTETSGAIKIGGTYPTAGYFDGMNDLDKAIAAARYIHLAFTRANSSAFFWWGLTYGINDWDAGLIIVDHNQTPMPIVENGITKKYFAFMQYSRFVRPSYLRVGLMNYSSSLISAYKSPDNETVAVVIINPNDAEEGLFITGIDSYKLCSAFRTDNVLDCNDVLYQWNKFMGNIPAKSVTTLVYCKDHLLGDFEPDGDVDFDDFRILVEQWLQAPGNPSADIAPQPNGDNFVDFQDFALLAKNWLTGVE